MNDKRITLFDPNRIFSNNFMNTFFSDLPVLQANAEIDMYEDDNVVVVKIKAPGFKKENIEIDVEDKILTITATSKLEETEEDKKKKYYYKEMRQESFTRSVALPSSVKSEDAKASFADGILTIELPKMEEAKPKKIQISAN
jgi:HSP20 family protein